MSINVTRGDFVHDYVAVRARPRTFPAAALMTVMIAVLLLAVAATVLGRGGSDDAQADAGDVLMQGP